MLFHAVSNQFLYCLAIGMVGTFISWCNPWLSPDSYFTQHSCRRCIAHRRGYVALHDVLMWLAGVCRSECARSEANEGSSVLMCDDPTGPEQDLLPDLPPSWVPKLIIPADMLDMRCPRVSPDCQREEGKAAELHAPEEFCAGEAHHTAA